MATNPPYDCGYGAVAAAFMGLYFVVFVALIILLIRPEASAGISGAIDLSIICNPYAYLLATVGALGFIVFALVAGGGDV